MLKYLGTVYYARRDWLMVSAVVRFAMVSHPGQKGLIDDYARSVVQLGDSAAAVIVAGTPYSPSSRKMRGPPALIP